MKKIAIIPAKSFSRRLSKKNFRKINNKTLVELTLINLIKSNIFDEIHISTDNKKILNILKKYKMKHKFFRKKSLCNNNTGLNEVISWTIEKYKKDYSLNFEVICLAYATAPLLDYKDFIQANKKFIKGNKNIPLISCCKYKPSIDEAMNLKKGILKPLYKNKFFKDSLKHKDYFFETGGFIFFSKKYFESNKFINNKKFRPYVLPPNKSFDIHTLQDLKMIKKFI